MNNLMKLCSAIRTSGVSSYNKKMFNSVPAERSGFYRSFGTPPSSRDPPKWDDPPDTDYDSIKSRNSHVNFFIQLHYGPRYPARFAAGQSLAVAIGSHSDIIGPGFGICNNRRECSTCHVKFTKDVYERITPICSMIEAITLRKADEFQEYSSRLACCLKLTKEMEDVTIYLPRTRRDVRKSDEDY